MKHRDKHHTGADQTRDSGRDQSPGSPRVNQNIQQGRLNEAEAQEVRDISDIDQDEGNMCNGELGGDMGCIDRNTRNEQ